MSIKVIKTFIYTLRMLNLTKITGNDPINEKVINDLTIKYITYILYWEINIFRFNGSFLPI